ncbi:MAG: RND transporter [Nitrospirae bacterium]|nr:RND transporter [Nitrospirota bacterium]MBF0540991.1 RND transporter [Nitrospirota bacterium]
MNWTTIIILCLTLGLAPFNPPHIVEKLQMLFNGKLVRPIDWFDLILHSTPWAILIYKIVITGLKKN